MATQMETSETITFNTFDATVLHRIASFGLQEGGSKQDRKSAFYACELLRQYFDCHDCGAPAGHFCKPEYGCSHIQRY